MRILSKLCLAFAVAAIIHADAPQLSAQNPAGGQVFEPDSFQQVASDVNLLGLPGRVWFRSNYADQGLGFEGAFLTLGAKRRVYEDSFDGRWLTEGRFHYGLEEGGFFANLGVERVFTIDAAKADIVTGFWYDYDGDEIGDFAHTFNQVSVNAAIKTRRWDLIGNGYFPVGTTDFDSSEITGNNFFFGNGIVINQGIDSALEGFDVTLRMRPRSLAFGNGFVDIGGYGYSSDLVNFFGGGRARLGFQMRSGLRITAEINSDDRFNTTGLLSLAWGFGGRGAASGAGLGTGNDLAETIRNDHIVRFNEGFVFATDPNTGAPINVIHVNSLADAAIGDGTFGTPFATLADAQANSGANDLIFVDGAGGSQGLGNGFVLQDNQQLLASGATHQIPIQNNQLFELTGDGTVTTISNVGGNAVVDLANNNNVSGFNIDAAGANFGIFGDGVNGATITNNTITGATQTGTQIQNFTGNITATGNNFNDNNIDGLSLVGGLDNQSVITLSQNTANNNGVDGINIEDFLADQIALQDNVTNDNIRNGLFIDDFGGQGLDLDIFEHTANNNAASGIVVNDGDGDIDIRNANANNNTINGVEVSDFSNTVAGDSTTIFNTEGSTAQISGNQNTNILLSLTEPGTTQDVLVTGATILDGQRGIVARVAGLDSELNVSILNNETISQHTGDGLRFEATESGTLNVLVENEEGEDPLFLNDNAQGGGAGIAFFANGDAADPTSNINAEVRNVSINNDGETGFTSSVIGNFAPEAVLVEGTGRSQVNLLVEDSRIESAGGFIIDLDNTGNGDVNNIFLRDLIVRADLPVFINSAGGTFLDFGLFGSDLQSNGNIRPVADGGSFNDPTESGDPFTDTAGDFGILANIAGDFGGGVDNMTRLTIVDNVIRDFTFEGINITTTGDSELLANISSNQILRNGPGNDDMVEFPVDDPATIADSDEVVDDQLGFFDGVVINSFDTSDVNLRFNANQLINNHEAGLTINNFGTGTVNGSLNFNGFANDIGQDADVTDPNNSTAFQTDFVASNFGFGTINLDLSSNTFGSDAIFNPNFTGIFNVELDGATNGFTDADLPLGVITGTTGITENLISNVEQLFATSGTVDDDTPIGGGFALAP